MIFLYHGIVGGDLPEERWCVGQALPVESFERHLRWLLRHFSIVPLAEWLGAGGRGRVALTFDDGLGATFAYVAPILAQLRVPATFFVSTQHLEHGPLLWFNVINALCFEGVYEEVAAGGRVFSLRSLEEKRSARHALGNMAAGSGDVRRFAGALAESYPLPADVAGRYEGMTHEQLALCGRDPLLEIGAHTLTHPLLGSLNDAEHDEEVLKCRTVLGNLTGRPVRYFAYPGGDYTHRTLELIRKGGYEAAFCTVPRRLGGDPGLEIERVGIYSPSLVKLRVKAMGVVPLLRRLGISVG